MKDVTKILALCDAEEEYAQLMTEYMRKQKELPWEVRTYTGPEELLREEQNFVLLVAAESVYSEELMRLHPAGLVVLNESGVMRWEGVTYVNKYQPAEEVVRSLLQIYLELEDAPLPRLGKNYNTDFIGFYTPVHRSMQTSLALTLAQILSREHRVLYLNFEACAGIGELLPNMTTRDLADLMFFLSNEKEKFRIRLQTLCLHLGALDYVPPMKSGQNLLSISAVEWVGLLQKIEELGEYEFVILDLSECIQGLFSLLRQCKRIFTLTDNDKMSQGKLMQYEQLLTLYEYEDIRGKTSRLDVPRIQRFPEELEQLTKSELAELACRIMGEQIEKIQ